MDSWEKNKYVYDFIGLLYLLQCCFSTLRFVETDLCTDDSGGPAVAFSRVKVWTLTPCWFFSFSPILLSLSCCLTQFGTSCSCWTNEPKILWYAEEFMVYSLTERCPGPVVPTALDRWWSAQSILTPTPLIPMEAIRVYLIIQGLILHRIPSSHVLHTFSLWSSFQIGVSVSRFRVTISQKSSQ